MTTAMFVDYACTAMRVQRQVADADLTLSAPPRAHDYFGRGNSRPDGPRPVGEPEGFLIEFPAHSRTGAHFHSCDQFQVFFPAAGAWYRSRPIERLVVHYVDAYTTYGPFGTGAEPMAFYTLRARPSTITGFMPAARDRWVAGGKRRNITADVELMAPPAMGGAVHTRDIIAAHDDGLAASLVIAPPEAMVLLPECGPRASGQYVCVIDGAVNVGEELYREYSLGWIGAGESPAPVRASGQGCNLLILRFPEFTDPAQQSQRRSAHLR